LGIQGLGYKEDGLEKRIRNVCYKIDKEAKEYEERYHSA
jgi:hypothetical protein